MDDVARYLTIPQDYAAALGGIRWSSEDDALNYVDGRTYAFNDEIALFVEGFCHIRSLIHFAFIAHWLEYFQLSARKLNAPDATVVDLGIQQLKVYQAFEETGRNIRNAGVFAGVISRGLPAWPEIIDPCQVRDRLRNRMMPMRWFVAQYQDPLGTAEQAPLTPQEFASRVDAALADYSAGELRHWLRHGMGPLKQTADAIVPAITPRHPKHLPDLIAGLVTRPRLAAAAPRISELASALTLPPRKLGCSYLPLGGYVDVALRGQPHDLLPSQFMLDEHEFDRRYAEHELLYFKREDPQSPPRQELIVLLDQGVRTWGEVRITLSAAALALARQAHRRKTHFRFAATSTEGRIIDPLEKEEQTFAEALEASDLSPNPGLALERILEEPAEDTLRDIVLLTHPRNLDEDDLRAAARRVGGLDRLFAAVVDANGQGGLHEFQHGCPVKYRHFRVNISDDAKVRQQHPAHFVDDFPLWRGDVEPIGFPFQFGIGSRIPSELFDFDHAGEWLMTVSGGGMLHVWRVDGTGMEVFPRGWTEQTPLTAVTALTGVAGGFAVGGYFKGRTTIFHYDLAARTCVAYQAPAMPFQCRLQYVGQYHSLRVCHALRVCHDSTTMQVIDLGSREQYPSSDSITGSTRNRARELFETTDCNLLYQRLRRLPKSISNRDHGFEPYFEHNPHTGVIRINDLEESGRWACTPLSNGVPVLKDCEVLAAQFQGHTLALLTKKPGFGRRERRLTLRLFTGPEGTPLAEFPHSNPGFGFVLSADGRKLARQIDVRQVEVRDVYQGGAPTLVTRNGGYHTKVRIHLGPQELEISAGKFCHHLCWERGDLEHQFLGPRKSAMEAAGKRNAGPYDSARIFALSTNSLTAVCDSFGQVRIVDKRVGDLVCMFFVYRNEIAGWMPDGTRWGSRRLLGAAAHPDASTKFVHALAAACKTERRGY